METILANTIYVCMYVCMVPIPKASKDKKLLISYRPIALTSCLLSKLAERLILARLEFVAESRHLIPAEQVGFRAKRSAEDSIGRLVQNVQDGWQRPNKGNRAGQPDGSTAQKYVLVAYDFSRAYDVVDHKLLRLRLLELGLPSAWLAGYGDGSETEEYGLRCRGHSPRSGSSARVYHKAVSCPPSCSCYGRLD